MRLIDADALAENLKESIVKCNEWMDNAKDAEIKARAESANVTFVECVLRIKDAPTIEAEPVRRGRWIRHKWAEEENGLLIDNFECTACGDWCKSETPYCPNCGAKMDGERKEE